MNSAVTPVPGLRSKLPDIGTTIFTVMSQLAADHDAINLSQGYPDFDGPERLLSLVNEYLHGGHNQYPPMMGVAPLREAIATKVADLYGAAVEPDTQVTVTSGATEALFCAIHAVVRAGDEVVVFDPAYDSYAPAVRLAGGRTVHVPLTSPDFSVDWERFEAALGPRTRLVIVNTPHNPTGSVWSAADMQRLAALVEHHGLFVLGDEVYEHIVFDAVEHQSLLRHPALAARSFSVSSFGKTYHVTGWKVGYCVAPPALTAEFRKVHQFVTFTTNTPVQLALGQFLAECPQHHLQLPMFYQAKRDLFRRLLADSRFELLPCAGTYFQTVDATAVTDEPDTAFVRRLTVEHGVAAIPLSVFHAADAPTHLIRLCFAKHDATLATAAQRLCAL